MAGKCFTGWVFTGHCHKRVKLGDESQQLQQQVKSECKIKMEIQKNALRYTTGLERE